MSFLRERLSPYTQMRLSRALQPNTLVKELSGAALAWSRLEADGTTATCIHKAFCASALEGAGLRERLRMRIGYLLSLPVALLTGAVLTRRCGPRVRAEIGTGLLQQFREQLALSRRLAIPPPWYYILELHDAGHRQRALEYLYRFETKAALYVTLRNRLTDPATTLALSNKAQFAERCRSHGVAAVPALAVASKGQVTRLDGGSDGLPCCDLFLKPLRGAGGRGASIWTFGDDGRYRSSEDATLDGPGLLDHLQTLSLGEDYVVRARVHNHPDLSDLACSALSTIRVLTCLDESGHPQVTHAVLKMACRTDVVVDNFHAGGIAAAVDLDTGVLGPASDMGLRRDSRWWDFHPITRARITGRTVPHWEQVPELARRAHAAFADQSVVGWDIAVCEDGPLLVEGNKSPDLDIVQRMGRKPIGNERFGELLLFQIGRALAVATPQGRADLTAGTGGATSAP